jgi:DNA-binding CsgD family transcriptional regulator
MTDLNDLHAFVVSLNLRRRHLSESQRAVVAAKLATLSHGGDRRSDQAANLPVVTQAEAAELLNLSERTVRTAREVLDHGAPELVRAVERGQVSVSAASAQDALGGAVRRMYAAGNSAQTIAAAIRLPVHRVQEILRERMRGSR